MEPSLPCLLVRGARLAVVSHRSHRSLLSFFQAGVVVVLLLLGLNEEGFRRSHDCSNASAVAPCLDNHSRNRDRVMLTINHSKINAMNVVNTQH